MFLTAPSPDKAVEASIEVMMHVDLESRSSLQVLLCSSHPLVGLRAGRRTDCIEGGGSQGHPGPLYRQWRVMNRINLRIEKNGRLVSTLSFIHSPLASRAAALSARGGCANHSFSRFLVPVPCLTIMTSNRPQITPSETI